MPTGFEVCRNVAALAFEQKKGRRLVQEEDGADRVQRREGGLY